MYPDGALLIMALSNLTLLYAPSSLGAPMYARSLRCAALPDGFSLGSMPLIIREIIVSGLLGWNGPCFGCSMLAISRNSLYSPTMLARVPLIMILSQLTSETRLPPRSSFATFEASLPAMWFVASTTIGQSVPATASRLARRSAFVLLARAPRPP